MVHGLTLDGSALGITQITAAQLQGLLTAFTNADSAYNGGRSARQAASDAFQAAAAALGDWLATAKNVLAGRFGPRWSTEWAQAGFVAHSTAVPQKFADQYALGQRLTGFFTNNPSYEVASMQVTAAEGRALCDAAGSAQQALGLAVKGLSDLDSTQSDAYTALTDVMWSLIKILQASLDDNDPRWLDFGLPMPSTPATPGKPVNLSAHLDGTGAIIAQCDAVALATRYRFRMLRVGIDPDYSLAASSPAPLGSIGGVLPGQSAQIIVQAVNGSLQGVASEPIVFTVPLPVAGREGKTAAPAAAGAGAGVSSNGNGNGNGNGRHHAAAPVLAAAGDGRSRVG